MECSSKISEYVIKIFFEQTYINVTYCLCISLKDIFPITLLKTNKGIIYAVLYNR